MTTEEAPENTDMPRNLTGPAGMALGANRWQHLNYQIRYLPRYFVLFFCHQGEVSSGYHPPGPDRWSSRMMAEREDSVVGLLGTFFALV